MLIVRTGGDDAIVSRLRAELRHDDWRIVEVPARAADAKRSLEVLAKARGASAALRARPAQLTVELWATSPGDWDKAGGEEVLAGPRADVGALALRVAEVLRARGLVPQRAEDSKGTGVTQAPQTDASSATSTTAPATSPQPDNTAKNVPQTSEPAPPSAAPASTPPADKPASPAPAAAVQPSNPPPSAAAAKPEPEPPSESKPEPEPTPADEASEPEADSGGLPSQPSVPALLYVELAPALVLSPGSPHALGPSLDALGTVRLQPNELVSFSLLVLAPLLKTSLSNDLGSADVRTLAVGGGADLQLPFDPWEFSAGLGAAALVTWVRGSMSEGYMMRDQTLRTFSLFGRVGLSWSLSSTVKVSARVLVGAALPTLRIEFVRMTQARWGAPFVAGTLGLEFALPWQR